MAVLRGILLFAFFGGLVWFAISQGMQQDAGMPQARAEWVDGDVAPPGGDDPYVIDTTPIDHGEGSNGDSRTEDAEAFAEEEFAEEEFAEEEFAEEEFVPATPVETDDRPDWLMMEPESEPAVAAEEPA
ncbi:MAG: hypothetical protein ACI8QZ_001662, partial [Chlamydiales bacterium]